MIKYIVLLTSILLSTHVLADEKRSFKCSQPLPEFTLSEKSNPTNEQIVELCVCIWSSFPENGWERKASEKIHFGEDPGWRGRAFVSRFGKALKVCGGYTL